MEPCLKGKQKGKWQEANAFEWERQYEFEWNDTNY